MDKKNKIVFSVLFGLFFVVTLLLVADKMSQKKSIVALESQLAHLDSTQRNLKSIRLLDNTFFNEKPEEALLGYESILEDSTFIDSREEVQMRVELIRKQLKENLSNMSESRQIDVIEVYDVGEVVSATDSIRIPLASSQHQKEDSLERRIVELNRKLSSRERALEKKEKVKATVITSPDGASIQYVGDTKDGQAHGRGTGLWEATGSTYKGDWVESKRHGYGVYTWKDGVRYEGDFRNDKREGKGTYFWPSGERYVGMWKNSQRNGEGILYDKDGNISFRGLWENDKPKKK